MDKKYEALKLENQLCFPLYAASRDVIKQYKTSLDNLDKKRKSGSDQPDSNQ